MEKKYSYQDNSELVMRFQNGDRSALDEICMCNSGLVRKMATEFARKTHLPFDDFYQEGMIGLIKAVKRFDPKQGAFSTYATWYLFAGMQKYAMANTGIVAIPADVMNDVRKATALNGAYAFLPKDERISSIAEEMQKTPQAVQELLGIGYRFCHSASLSMPLTDEKQESLLEHAVAAVPDTADAVSIHRARKEVCDQLLKYLKPRQLYIIQLRNGLTGEEPYSLEQIGWKLGVTRGRVRQIEARAYRIMRRAAHVNRIRKEDILPDPEEYSVCYSRKKGR